MCTHIHALQIQYDANFETIARFPAEAGFSTVSLGFGSSDVFFHDDWEQKILEISHILERNRLSCVQTHLFCYSLLKSAEESDPDTDQAILRSLAAGAMLGSPWNVHHLRTAISDHFNHAFSLYYNRKALVPIVNEAITRNCGLALENLPIFPCWHPEWNFFSSDYEDLLTLCKEINDPHVGICWDFGHANLKEIDQEKALLKIGSRLRATHIHNNEGFDDSHFLPSQGRILWKPLMKALKAIDYKLPLTLEINYACNDATPSFFAHAADCLNLLENDFEN